MTTKTKAYLKEILKTTAKVALMGTATVAAGIYTFGFAAGFFNLLAAGYAVGGFVLGAGTLATLKTLVKDVVTMPGRINAKQREEKIDRRLEKLEKICEEKQKENQPQKQIQPQTEMIQKKEQVGELIAKKRLPWNRVKRAKEYDRAA